MFRVMVNRERGRILVTGKDRDLRLLDEGWELVYESFDWEDAFEYAMEIADDEIVEWYYDEEVKKKFVKGLSIAA
ncbi:hypothetical protein ODS41_12905 [Pyrobaculum sp. 3827-6]|uniref:Uncharacterized protein n=1 Tax=Pyrobaculum ferrireducens TaxID=1104324 RepID=G7VEF8_9CREN|nr:MULTISPECIES: hypothetical protein [Pyrobaculum]AET31582.1 hypothetical protein P186_0114 [Pyrobaculum ferrireducens]MCU7788812.1 hypothetical protein [Pyrobaculum sp. 3827-6]